MEGLDRRMPWMLKPLLPLLLLIPGTLQASPESREGVNGVLWAVIIVGGVLSTLTLIGILALCVCLAQLKEKKAEEPPPQAQPVVQVVVNAASPTRISQKRTKSVSRSDRTQQNSDSLARSDGTQKSDIHLDSTQIRSAPRNLKEEGGGSHLGLGERGGEDGRGEGEKRTSISPRMISMSASARNLSAPINTGRAGPPTEIEGTTTETGTGTVGPSEDSGYG